MGSPAVTKQTLTLGILLGFSLLPWWGCGRADDHDGCAGNACAGKTATGGGSATGASSTTGGNSAGGAPSAGGCATCGGTPAAAGAPPVSDCEAGAGGCPGSLCAPNTYRCSGNDVLLCSGDGASEKLAQTCKSDEYCEPRRALCVPRLCTPESLSCDGANVVVCNADGSATRVTKTCSLNQVCSAGECHDIVCVPNTRYCTGQDVWRCSADGTAATLTKHCSDKQFCLEESGDADCSATKCVAGAALCSDDRATTCLPDGSGPAPGADDCAAHGQACYEGECRDLACTPGHKLCDHDNVYLCTENGTATTLFSECVHATEYCDPVTAACRARICTPGTSGCDGTRVATCDSLGSRWVASDTDCDQQGKICLNGSCKSVVCTANQYLCSQGDIYLCNSNGTASTLYQNCTSNNSRCQLVGVNYAYCASNPCTANAKSCSGNTILTCNADGTAWLAGGTDCAASGKACQNGACIAPVCTPYSVYCSGSEVRQCAYDGATWYVSATCGGGTSCLAQNDSASCQRTPCSASSVACLSEQLGTCAADGSSLASVTSDCGAQSKVCTAAGCADVAVDTLGSGNQIETPTDALLGNQIRVQTTRTLTQIEAYLSLPASRALTWVVYEIVGSGQYFSLVYSAATTGTGTGFQSSGSLSYSLQAGKTYLLGVNITGSYVAYYTSPVEPRTLSFATALGATTAYAAVNSVYAYLQEERLYYFRYTSKR